MKIVLFTEIYNCGGIETFISNLLNNWPDPNDDFVLIANNNYPGLSIIARQVTGRNLMIEKHRVSTFTDFASNSAKRGKLFCSIARILSPISRYLLLVYSVFALKSRICKHKPDLLIIVNGGYPGGDSCRAAAISWALFGNGVQSVHNFHNLATSPRLLLLIQEAVTDFFVNLSTRKFITVSKAAADSMGTRLMISKAKVGYIHNGLESFKGPEMHGDVDIRSELGIPPACPLCLMLATYEPRKGHEFLLRSFKKVLHRMPEVHLVICGYGLPESVAHVAGRVDRFGLGGNVHLLNFRPDAMSILTQANLLLCASQSFESFGLTSVEAMMRKIPVVATAVGGVPEVVVDGEGRRSEGWKRRGKRIPKKKDKKNKKKTLSLNPGNSGLKIKNACC